MLLSDRDIRSELSSGRIGLDPLELEMVQPSSVDVRLDRFFRLFDIRVSVLSHKALKTLHFLGDSPGPHNPRLKLLVFREKVSRSR